MKEDGVETELTASVLFSISGSGSAQNGKNTGAYLEWLIISALSYSSSSILGYDIFLSTGLDFESLSTPHLFTLQPEDTRVEVPINITDDGIPEGRENTFFFLSAPGSSPYTLGIQSTNIIITDNDSEL